MNTKKGFVAAFKAFWFRAGDFRGSSTRGQYWWIFLINFLLGLVFVVALIGGALSSFMAIGPNSNVNPFHLFGNVAGVTFILLLFWFLYQGLPSLSLVIRRYRDAGVTPWVLLLTELAPGIILAIAGRNTTGQVIAGLLRLADLVITLLPTRHPVPAWTTQPNEDSRAVSMVGAIPDFFRRGGVFSGRSSRSQYWWITLWGVIIGIAITVISVPFTVISVVSSLNSASGVPDLTGFFMYLGVLLGLTSLIYLPNLTLTVRRFRDAGVNPWWYGVLFIMQLGASAFIAGSKQFNWGFIIVGILSIVLLVITVLPTKQSA